MNSLLFAIFCVLSFQAIASDMQVPRIATSINGISIYWQGSRELSFNILRGESPDHLVEIAKNVRAPAPASPRYLDTTAEPGKTYYYKVIATSQIVSAQMELPPPGKVIHLRDWVTGDHFDLPHRYNIRDQEMSNGSRAPNADIGSPPHFRGRGYSTNGGSIGYERSMYDNLEPGKKYIVRISFGHVHPSGASGGNMRLSLSPRRPVKDVIVDSKTIEGYAEKTVEFSLIGGPKEWGVFSLLIKANKGKSLGVWIKKIVLYDPEKETAK